MLSAEENALLCRIEADAPMGRMVRRYWIPAALSEDVAADGAPRRVRLMGEDLIVFRDSRGTSVCSKSSAPIAVPPAVASSRGLFRARQRALSWRHT